MMLLEYTGFSVSVVFQASPAYVHICDRKLVSAHAAGRYKPFKFGRPYFEHELAICHGSPDTTSSDVRDREKGDDSGPVGLSESATQRRAGGSGAAAGKGDGTGFDTTAGGFIASLAGGLRHGGSQFCRECLPLRDLICFTSRLDSGIFGLPAFVHALLNLGVQTDHLHQAISERASPAIPARSHRQPGPRRPECPCGHVHVESRGQ